MSKSVVYIVNSNKIKAVSLRKFLLNKFPNELEIFIFFNNSSCVKMLYNGVDMVINDCDKLNEQSHTASSSLENGLAFFPNTRLVSFISIQTGVNAITQMHIEKFRIGSSTLSGRLPIVRLIELRITQSLRTLEKEYIEVKFLGIIMLSFSVMIALVIWIINLND